MANGYFTAIMNDGPLDGCRFHDCQDVRDTAFFRLDRLCLAWDDVIDDFINRDFRVVAKYQRIKKVNCALGKYHIYYWMPTSGGKTKAL